MLIHSFFLCWFIDVIAPIVQDEDERNGMKGNDMDTEGFADGMEPSIYGVICGD